LSSEDEDQSEGSWISSNCGVHNQL
jgi:hypothetical protein